MKNLERRDFLRLAVGITLAYPMLKHNASAATSGKLDEQTNVLRIKSGESKLAPATHHFHYLDIPKKYFDNPPENGIEVKTTTSYLHKHNVRLSKQNLIDIAAGEPVTVEDTVHDHDYKIFLQN